MTETIKHLLGICGEAHPNIYTILFILIILRTAINKIKTYTK